MRARNGAWQPTTRRGDVSPVKRSKSGLGEAPQAGHPGSTGRGEMGVGVLTNFVLAIDVWLIKQHAQCVLVALVAASKLKHLRTRYHSCPYPPQLPTDWLTEVSCSTLSRAHATHGGVTVIGGKPSTEVPGGGGAAKAMCFLRA